MKFTLSDDASLRLGPTPVGTPQFHENLFQVVIGPTINGLEAEVHRLFGALEERVFHVAVGYAIDVYKAAYAQGYHEGLTAEHRYGQEAVNGGS